MTAHESDDMASRFPRSDGFPIWEYPRIFLARMTAHGSDDKASRFPESLSEAQISEINEKAIPINKKKVTKFGFSVFQYKILLLNIILSVNFTREAEIVTLTRNNCQLPSLFTDFKIRYKNTKIVIFYFTNSLVGIC